MRLQNDKKTIESKVSNSFDGQSKSQCQFSLGRKAQKDSEVGPHYINGMRCTQENLGMRKEMTGKNRRITFLEATVGMINR